MKRILSTLAVATALAVAPSAHAADFFPGTVTANGFFGASGDGSTGPVTASFARFGLSAGASFDRFIFALAADGLGGGSITTSFTSLVNIADLLNPNNLDFVDDPFIAGADSGVNFSNDGGATWIPIPIDFDGTQESGAKNGIPITFDTDNILRVNYLSRGNGSYGGQLEFTPNAAVPEPTTWALAIIGFALVGFSMRRRRKEQIRVRYAF